MGWLTNSWNIWLSFSSQDQAVSTAGHKIKSVLELSEKFSNILIPGQGMQLNMHKSPGLDPPNSKQSLPQYPVLFPEFLI